MTYQFHSWAFIQESEKLHSLKKPHSILWNGQELDTTQMSINGWMWCISYYKILLSNKKKWTIGTQYNCDGSQGHHIAQPKKKSQNVTYWVISFIWHYWNNKTIDIKNIGCHGLGMGGVFYVRVPQGACSNRPVLCHDCGVCFTKLYLIKLHLTTHKHMQRDTNECMYNW